MRREPLMAVIGADGFVGGGLADGLQARRVVYGAARDGERHIDEARELLEAADVVVNAGGFRVRRGLRYEDYRRCHSDATAAFLPWLRRDALLVHVSTAHVMGKSPGRALGNCDPPNPGTYPSAAYARAKLEADELVEREAAQRGFRAVLLRPTIVYGRPGDTSLPDNLCKWARRGTMLRFYPRDARHHFCHLDLLVEVVRRLTATAERLPDLKHVVVSDPYTITSRELDDLITRHLRGRRRVIPIPASLMSAILGRTFHSRNPAFDLKTWGDIFGVFQLDTVYDASETYRLLGVDPSRWSLAATLQPFIRQALGS